MKRSVGGPSRHADLAPADSRLLAIAADQLKEFGPRHITVVGIADAAGMTHANVYRYFANKAALIDAVAAHMKDVRAAPTWDDAATYSPIISERQLSRIDGIVRQAIETGAECVIGGGAMESQGYFYRPTILANVARTSPAFSDEIFGPVLTVETFAAEEEALTLSDHPTYGLAAGLYTRDLSRALRLFRQIQAGTVWVNRYSRSRDHILPTGGYKRSGLGKDLGRDAYLANRNSKSVLIGL